MPSRFSALLAVLFALLLGACGESKRFVGDCEVDADCPVGSACRRDARDATGTCVCRSDEACPEGTFCNAGGVCQKKTGCRSNADCADRSRYCDLASGDCLERTRCGIDVHCPPGTVCDSAASQCVNGCRSNGDCSLGQVCDRTGQPAGALGACLSGICDGDAFCPFGQECSGRQCVPALSRDHCAPCGDGRACGERSSFCLVNSAYDPSDPSTGDPSFCGVECTSDPEVCPSGYQCGSVVLLTQDQCTSDTECGGGGRRCAIGEGNLRGFCTCVEDADCRYEQIPPTCRRSCSGFGVIPCERNSDCRSNRCIGTCAGTAGQQCNQDSECPAIDVCQRGTCVTDGITRCSSAEDCLCRAGTCFNSGRPCSRGADCNPPCMNGGCYLGDACAPEEGLTCAQVR